MLAKLFGNRLLFRKHAIVYRLGRSERLGTSSDSCRPIAGLFTASAQNELTPPATSKTVFPISSCDSRRKYRRYSSNVQPSNTTRSSCSPRFARWIITHSRVPSCRGIRCGERLSNLRSPWRASLRDHPQLLRVPRSEHCENAVGVSSDSHPRVVAVAQSHRPKIEIAVQPVAGSVERCRTSYGSIMVCFIDERRLESFEIL